MSDDRAIVQHLLSHVPNLIAVYRFGSSVRGSARRDSDVDLGVLATDPLDPAGALKSNRRWRRSCIGTWI
jgi:predicted nucleotidyltransferase